MLRWTNISAGVPQGSVLGPLLFLIYINDIACFLESKCFLYADDTSLFEIVDDPSLSAAKLNSDLESINVWSNKWQVSMNPKKTKTMIFSVKKNKPAHPHLYSSGKVIDEVDCHTHLGLTLSSNLSWREHILNIYSKASKRVHVLKRLKYKLNRATLIVLYKSMIRSIMEYADVVWDGCDAYLSDMLENIQYQSSIIVTGALKGTSKHCLLDELGWEDLKMRRLVHKLIIFYKIVNDHTPPPLKSFLPKKISEISKFPLRNKDNFDSIPTKTERYKTSFFPSAISKWNSLDICVRNQRSLQKYREHLNTLFLSKRYNEVYNVSLSRYASILHTRLRLGFHALNSYLFRINRRESQECDSCSGINETVQHYFLYCSRYSAQRTQLFVYTSSLFDDWTKLSDKKKVGIILYGSDKLSRKQNVQLFIAIQKFIVETQRFAS